MSRFGALTALALLVAVPAGAFIKPSLKYTWGDQRYRGISAAVDVGGDTFHVKPAYNSYSSSSSSGTWYTGSVRAAYDYDIYELGLSGGWTTLINGYKNYFAGGDLSASYDFGEPSAAQGKPSQAPIISHLDLNAGITSRIHSQTVTTPAINAGVFSVPATTTTGHVSELDVEGSAALTILDYTVSLTVTKSVYDKDLSRISQRIAPFTAFAGANANIQGFPSLSATTRVDFEAVPVVKPYLSYTYTSFKVTQPSSADYGAGVTSGDTFDWGYLLASYERYSQKGSADVNYYSLGASARFK